MTEGEVETETEDGDEYDIALEDLEDFNQQDKGDETARFAGALMLGVGAVSFAFCWAWAALVGPVQSGMLAMTSGWLILGTLIRFMEVTAV